MAVVVAAGGKFYYMDYGDSSLTQRALPAGVQAMPEAMRPLPCYAKWEGDSFVAGYFSRTLRFTDNYELVEGGIHQPPQLPTMVAGASAGGSSGVALGYITFAQERIGPSGQSVTVHESNPTGPTTPAVTLTGQGRSWGNLPTSSVDPRVTHVYGYVSMDGAIPRLAWKREIRAGVTTVTENVLTALLGIELPTITNPDGEVDIDTEARGVAPYCKIVVPFHDAMFYMGFPDKPWLIAPSRLFEPESVNIADDSDTALVTRGREAVIGAYVHEASERLIVFCDPPKIYAITGYGPDDREIVPINGFYRLLSHHGIRKVGPAGDLYFPSQEGVALFNGGFRSIFEDREQEWKDLLQSNPAAFAKAWAVFANDSQASGYKLRIPIADPESATRLSYYFYGVDDPVQGGGQPWWTDDARTRNDTSAAEVRPYGKPWAEVWTGSSDGFIRREDQAANADDDGDAYLKRFDVTHAHWWMPSQAGDEQHGSKVTNVDVYLKNELQDATLELYAGDESATDAVSPSNSKILEAGKLPTGKKQKVALTSRRISAGALASGKGVAVRIYIDSPTNIEYRGVSLSYEDGGQQDRLPAEE